MSETGPGFDPTRAIAVGRVLAPHGVKGEVKVEPETEAPERFQAGARLWLRGEPVLVEGSRWQRGALYLKLAGVDTREAADALRGAELQIPEAPALEEGRYYRHEVVGLRVEDRRGEELGRVTDIIATGANDVYVVQGSRGELLLPAVDDVVLEVDPGQGRMVVELMEGLGFEQRRAPGAIRRRGHKAKPGGQARQRPSER